MKCIFVAIVMSSALITTPARADLFGGDLVLLSQLLTNAIQQLAQLRQVLGVGQDTLGLLRDINRGIDDSLSLARTVGQHLDPGLYKDWQTIQGALNQIERIYGVAAASPDQQIQRDADQNVAEAVRLNNSIFEYTRRIDEIGERVKAASHDASPGGAQRITAQTLGVMLHVMNESLRTQGAGLKLQAQAIALQNKKDKDSTREYLKNADALKAAMKNEKVQFQVPRFQ